MNRYSKDGLQENFCRNPDNAKKPWCYTTGKERWEYCFEVAGEPTIVKRQKG